MPSIRRLAVLFAWSFVVVSCTWFGTEAVDTTTPPTVVTTTSTTATTAPPPPAPSTAPATPSTTEVPVDVTLSDCDAPAGDLDLLCDVHRLLVRQYVDPLDDDALAKGAVEGLETYVAEPDVPEQGPVSCSVPSDRFAVFCQRWAQLQTVDGVEDESAVEAAIRGMLDFGIGDPNTNYLPPDLYQAFNEENNGQIQGIGALVNTRNLADETQPCMVISDTCRMEIVSPLEGSPAEREGIRAGDVIVTVNGESITGLILDEVVSIVRGPAGTDVLLGIERDGQVSEVTVTRAAIDVPIVESEMLDDDIGYVRLIQFTFNSAEPFRAALEDLIDQGASSIIFDLQSNPGGSLEAAIEVASEFLADGEVLRTEAPDEEITYQVIEGGVATDPALDIYVLVNRGSASASEVVAGALRDAGRATLIGESTFGKNTVQRQYVLDNGGAVKITIARWVTPKGDDFGQVGIEPDLIVEYPPDAGFDFLRDQAVELIEAGG